MASVQAHRFRILAATGLKASLILLMLCGASQGVVDLADEIEVTQERGVVRFRFYTRDLEFGDWVPVEATSLSVRAASAPQPIWRVDARSPSSATGAMTYGVAPKGFVQRVPASRPMLRTRYPMFRCPLEGDRKSPALEVRHGDVRLLMPRSRAGESGVSPPRNPRFKTARQIGVGSTFGQLLAAHCKPRSVEYPEGALFAVYDFEDGSIGFQMTQDNWELGDEIPQSAPIVRVVTMGQRVP